MVVSVERKKETPQSKPDLQEVPQDFEVSPSLQGQITPKPSQFTAQVRDDTGQDLIQTPLTQTTTIQIPSDEATLTALSKGSVVDAITWFAAFWLRIIKKAIRLGWQIVVGAGKAGK